jgi:hypothetical protein
VSVLALGIYIVLGHRFGTNQPEQAIIMAISIPKQEYFIRLHLTPLKPDI